MSIEVNQYRTQVSCLHKRATPKKITKQRTAKKIQANLGNHVGDDAAQEKKSIGTGNVEDVLENSKQVAVTDAPAVIDIIDNVDNADVFVFDEAAVVAVVADQAAAVVTDGLAIAQQRVKDRAIALGRPDLVPFVERFNVPVGLTNNEINRLLSAM
ncbi:hypothetical protein BDK51DRAFT_25554 [Blyttiomyces helicus]|uniref:Uncharacterized protein n=1 Tax=Blyttiomyces helicus TaxID=388810 RepID=A0A4V1ISA8_9FUNG|nr:hypothetical protein BDK51DRAFT_25554 [Blyttiomyces helicus]|eukprot:RKO92907.1 hypothetical protein BDK51DRAFT_25554 [Blyttiomyces helicus]